MGAAEHRSARCLGFGLTGAAFGAVAITRHHWGRSRMKDAELAERERRLAVLGDRLVTVEAEARRQQGRMHEVTATVGALCSAAEVLPTLGTRQRVDLQSMMGAELERLRRVVGAVTSGPGRSEAAEVIDVDLVVGRLAALHRTHGRSVVWRASGAWARGNADALAEALNVLLENAARHGAVNDIRIETRTGERVHVVVSDGGAGVPAHLRARVFDWGTHRPGSPGTGIGLHEAREQLRACGGELRLARHGGSRFVIELPVAHRSAVDRSEVLAG